MEQLGIKHLGRRLAHNTAYYVEDIESGEVDILFPSSINLASETIEIGATEFDFSEIGKNVNGIICKPIYRDLSCLTKEITHNGEKFTPMVELLKIVDKDYYKEHLNSRYSEIECKAYPNYCDVYFKYMATKSLRIWVNDLCNERFWIIEKLLEWHFRLDEPEGTWIDVNTLPKNPYE